MVGRGTQATLSSRRGPLRPGDEALDLLALEVASPEELDGDSDVPSLERLP